MLRTTASNLSELKTEFGGGEGGRVLPNNELMEEVPLD